VARGLKRELGPGGFRAIERRDKVEDLTRDAGLERDRPVPAPIDTPERSFRTQPWASRPAEGCASQAHGRSPPSTGGQGVGGQSLEGGSPGEHWPAGGLIRRAPGTARPRDQSPGGEFLVLPSSSRDVCGRWSMGRRRRIDRHRVRIEHAGNVRRAAGVERRHGSAAGSKALKGEPHGRDRDETSPEGTWRSKPPGGCETLEAERTG
jgi:hypothetical protein